MDWQSLLHQSEELVTQDYHEFPRVSRNIEQLHQYAEGLRARTGKYRSLSDQNASTRLLAQQGFDTTRLAQDVSMLEVRPTVEDVFDGGVTSVEEYLKQVEESTILSAIQDAQRDTVASFDCYMEDCMSRDWAANKRQLFSIIAPHTGAVAAPAALAPATPQQPATGGVLIGVTPRQAGAPAGGTPSAPVITAGLGQSVSAKEAAYNEVLVRWSQAAASSASRQQAPAPDLLREFSAACKSKDEQTSETSMSACWSLLVDILSESKARGVPPQPLGRFTEALLSGARKNLERGHVAHMRTTIHRHKVAAERGPDPDPLREVQAYVLLKVGTAKGPLDFQQPGGHDTSWLQVFYCLRNGWHDAAKRAAERTQDVVAGRLGDVGFKALLDEWLRNGGRLNDRTAAVLVRDVDRLLRDKAALKSQLRQPYLVLLCALLAGYAHALDALTATLSQLQVASVLTTLEDFMWAKLAVVNLQGGSGPLSLQVPTSAADHYSLERLQADLNRWPASYYSKQGKEPLLYVTVLLLSLQFQAALKFLWKDETARQYRVDAVHLAIAMHTEGLLKLPSGESGPDVGSMLHSYGRKFVHSSSHLALAYYMLAASVKGGGLAVKGHMLRELLTESGDFGSLLGGGGAAGAGGPLAAYMPDVEERKRLFEAVAYECQVAAQPTEAVELYMAADRPRQALAVLNAQLSAALQRAVEEQAGEQPNGSTAARDAVVRIMARGRDARQRITVAGDAPPAAGSSTTPGRSPGPDAGARSEVEAFDQLGVVYDLLLANLKGRHDMALQKLAELPFIPLEHARVAACIRVATQLHSAVQERLPDVLSAAADAINAAAKAASRSGGSQRILRGQLDALLAFANSVPHRLSKGVYQKLCETAASFA